MMIYGHSRTISSYTPGLDIFIQPCEGPSIKKFIIYPSILIDLESSFSSKNLNIGDLFYAIPYHICPTVAKYNKSYVVINGEIQSSWDIQARDYQLSI